MKIAKIGLLTVLCLSIALVTHITWAHVLWDVSGQQQIEHEHAQKGDPNLLDPLEQQKLINRVNTLETKFIELTNVAGAIEETLMSRAELIERFEDKILEYSKKIKAFEDQNTQLKLEINSLKSVVELTKFGDILKSKPDYNASTEYKLTAPITAYPEITKAKPADSETIKLEKDITIKIKNMLYSKETKSWWLQIETLRPKTEPAKTGWINNDTLSKNPLEQLKKPK